MKRGPAVVVLVALASALCWFAAFASEEAFGGNAPAPTVVVLSLAASDEVAKEATARVKGELVAVGFQVALAALSGDDTLRELESAGRERNAVAAFAIFVRPFEEGTSVAEIWVSDRIRQKVIIQSAVLRETDRDRGSEILAVRAVEVLKANLADFWAPSPVPPADVVHPASEPPPVSPTADGGHKPRNAFAAGLGGGLGAGVVESFGASDASWSPEAMASYGWDNGLSLRATFAALGPASAFSATDGSASAQRGLALLEAVKTWWPRSAVVPFVAGGGGAQQVHVVGVGDPPYQGHTSNRWSLATTLGAGIAIPLVSTLSFLVQARGFAAWPPSVVQIAGADAARIGTPSLLADGALFGTLP
jgi:hypothetical protein